MVKESTKKEETNTLVYAEKGLNFDELGIGSEVESDRIELDEMGPVQLHRYRIDTKTKWFKEGDANKLGILKFDGVTESGESIKCRTTSKVIIQGFFELDAKVGSKIQDINGNEWNIFVKPINIHGFEKKRTESGSYIRFKNPLLN